MFWWSLAYESHDLEKVSHVSVARNTLRNKVSKKQHLGSNSEIIFSKPGFTRNALWENDFKFQPYNLAQFSTIADGSLDLSKSTHLFDLLGPFAREPSAIFNLILTVLYQHDQVVLDTRIYCLYMWNNIQCCSFGKSMFPNPRDNTKLQVMKITIDTYRVF